MNMRRLHRWVSVIAAVFVLYVATTGLMMAFDNIWGSIYMRAHGLMIPGRANGPPPALVKMFADSGTVPDQQLPALLNVTLKAVQRGSFQQGLPRVIRLRNYGGMPQGAVVTGGETAQQVVFNGESGEEVGLYEPGYPRTPMPFQWGAHETWKRMHRGDVFGLTGRWIDLASGLAILFLTVSGMTMYLQLHKSRRRLNRRSVFWR